MVLIPRGSGLKIGGGQYYAVGSVTILKATSGNNNAIIRWQDPDDTTLDEIVFAKWAGTLVVRKEGEAPKNEKDGDVILDSKVKNQYQDKDFIDEDVQSGKTYYYGLFPYTDKGVYNNNVKNVTKVLIKKFPELFSDATWDDVILACETNQVPDTWVIGDEKDITLSGYLNETITMQIWGKKIDDLSDGSGKAPITFGMKNLLSKMSTLDDSSKTDGWANSDLRKNTIPSMLESFPENIKPYIKSVKNWYTKSGFNAGTQVSQYQIDDKLWIPSVNNVGLENSTISAPSDHKYSIFTDDKSRIKKRSGINDDWWLRSAYHSNSYFLYVTDAGKRSDGTNTLRGICLCFCL